MVNWERLENESWHTSTSNDGAVLEIKDNNSSNHRIWTANFLQEMQLPT